MRTPARAAPSRPGARPRRSTGVWPRLHVPRSERKLPDARPPHPPPLPESDGLPEIVTKAQEDARCRAALGRLGYANVRRLHAWHKREGMATFLSLEREFLWPTTEFVRMWLKAERKRILVRLRWPFLTAMLATIVVGLASLALARLLHW
jgi:hypothetical protein